LAYWGKSIISRLLSPDHRDTRWRGAAEWLQAEQ